MVNDNSIYVPWSIRSRSKHYLWCGVWGAGDGGDRELGAGGGMDFPTSVALPPRLRSYLAVRFYTHDASDVQRHSPSQGCVNNALLRREPRNIQRDLAFHMHEMTRHAKRREREAEHDRLDPSDHQSNGHSSSITEPNWMQ